MLKFRWETEFEETEIGEISRDWEVKRLGSILDIKHGYAFPSKFFKEIGEVPVIKIQNIQEDNSIDLKDIQFINPYEINKNLENFYLENGDILIALTGATAGKIGILKGDYQKYLLNQRVGKIEIKDNSSLLLFVFYCLIYEVYRDWLLDLAEGSAQGNMSPSDIRRYIIIPYPPLPEQSRIAEVLSYFDDLIENKKRQNEILEKTAMAIFKNWFVDFEPFK
ncbi:MAG: restriction endonuclease subunit S, partial [Candidatus Omnitrophica bacterium]|nr:restriction endonuclease subunit S [Candidatus Omnitrophota bacterium]